MVNKSGKLSGLPIPALIAGFAALALIHFFPAGSIVAALCVFAAPAFFLYSSHQCRSRTELLITGLVFAAGLIMMNLNYCPTVLLDIAIFFLSAVYISLAFILDRHFGGENRSFLTTLIFPAVWVSLFYISTLVNLGFQFRFNAYVTPLRAFLQIESIVGSFGVLFLILWTASVVVYIFEKGHSASLPGVVVWALIMVGSVLFGSARMQSTSPDSETVRIAYTTGPYVGTYTDYQELDYESYARSLEKSVAAAADGGAELVMFSEEAFLIPDVREDEYRSLLSNLACKYSINILTGEEISDTDGSENGKRFNRIRWTDPDGKQLFCYTKHSIVPIVESSSIVRGEAGIPILDIPFKCGNVKLACAICYDSNFSSYISTIPEDTMLLLLPSWDWAHVSEYHGEVAREIAVENGVTVLKDTYDGISLAVSPLGETLAASRSEESGYETPVFADIPVQCRNTVFGIAGYLYGYVITGLTAAAVILLEIRKRREKEVGEQ